MFLQTSYQSGSVGEVNANSLIPASLMISSWPLLVFWHAFYLLVGKSDGHSLKSNYYPRLKIKAFCFTTLFQNCPSWWDGAGSWYLKSSKSKSSICCFRAYGCDFRLFGIVFGHFIAWYVWNIFGYLRSFCFHPLHHHCYPFTPLSVWIRIFKLSKWSEIRTRTYFRL
jgi:hypothetical protein